MASGAAQWSDLPDDLVGDIVSRCAASVRVVCRQFRARWRPPPDEVRRGIQRAAAYNLPRALAFWLRHATADDIRAGDAFALWVASANGHVEVVRRLLAVDAGVPACEEALNAAAANGEAAVVEALLAAVPGVEASGALLAASASGHDEVVLLLLRHSVDADLVQRRTARQV